MKRKTTPDVHLNVYVINHQLNQYRNHARELLTSGEGLHHRSRRSIEPEAVFGQTKASKQYDRFRHFGLEKVKMDFAIFAIAIMYNKSKNGKNRLLLLTFVLALTPDENIERKILSTRI